MEVERSIKVYWMISNMQYILIQETLSLEFCMARLLSDALNYLCGVFIFQSLCY